MSKWTFVVNLSSFYHDESLDIQEKANRLVKKLDILSGQVEHSNKLTDDDKYHYTDKLDEIKCQLEELDGDSPLEKMQYFDYAMSDLYDLGDSIIKTDQKYSFFNTPKFCWIKTR